MRHRFSVWTAVTLMAAVTVVAVTIALAGVESATHSTRGAGADRDLRLASGHNAATAVAVDPAYFSPGSCRAFAPTAGNRHLTVFLDAGHGGPDPGAVGSTLAGKPVNEADLTVRVVVDAMTTLRSQGFRVVVSRTGPAPVLRPGPGDTAGQMFTADGSHDDVVARPLCANMARANVLVGVYFNSGPPGGAGCITGYDAARPFANANLRLARLVQSAVLAAMNSRGWKIPDDGVLTDTGLGSSVTAADHGYSHLVLLGPAKRGYFGTPSMMPGALIEPLFVTDAFEASIAASSTGQHVIADGLVAAIDRFFAAPRAAV